MRSPLTGSIPLFRVTLRHNIRKIMLWVVLISVLSASSIIAYRLIFPDATDRVGFAAALGSNPALDLIFGPARDLMSDDGFNAWRAGQLGALFSALMAILTVVNNSRADEDSGQAELIASGVIARQARLIVAIAVASIAAVALGVVCFVLTWVCGGGANATAVLSTSFVGMALVFAGVAAVAAQLGSDARVASSLSIGTLGVLYVARGYLDSSQAPSWTQWLTPFGWVERMAPAADNDLRPFLAFVALFVVLTVVALVLQQHRDFGQGMVSPRPGATRAPRMGIVALTWRLHRGSLVTWMVGFALLGMVFGNLATSVGDVFADNPALAQVLASGATTTTQLSFGFVATILQIVGIVTAIMGAQVMMRVHAEEVDYRVEPLLAGSLRRSSYFASNVLFALVADVLALMIAGSVLGLVASQGGAPVGFADVLAQACATIPAVWTLTAVSVAVIGARPRVRLAGWLVIVATFGITLLGPTFKFPDWALGISPLHHVPTVIADSPNWWALGALVLVACCFVVIGFVGFRRRDIE